MKASMEEGNEKEDSKGNPGEELMFGLAWDGGLGNRKIKEKGVHKKSLKNTFSIYMVPFM